MLIAAIWTSNDRFGGAEPNEQTQALLPQLSQMTDDSLREVDVDAMEFPYLLQAAAAFHEDRCWGRCFEQLAGQEFAGVCPACATDLFVAIGADGNFLSAEDYIRLPRAVRSPITKSQADSLPSDGAWLRKHAVECGREETATSIDYMFGGARCPACNADISVADAIRLGCCA